MKRRLTFSAVFLSLIGAVLVWANHLENPLPSEAWADLVVLEKSKRELAVYSQGQLLKTYKVALGRVPAGAKRSEGDKKTPEGQYIIDYRKADSGYFRALHVSYPSPADTEAARKQGEAPGGDIMIHGLRNGVGWLGKLHRLADWTLGCIAVTNEEMEELWQTVQDGTVIELRP
ncbi:L,D-transpeptidase family protein [Methylomonas sp. BW4-1]|uniref:L,D-transpeptidase family protein n=1 Tax=Methylomonas sp. BW4-1 TaxID=3376685 RepID=UPI0040414635